MNLPKLRLRQVQEHSSHFKVKRGGQEIKIAKKALSPKMIGRLRAFAMGGEVTSRQVGGEITATGETEEQLTQRLEREQAELDRIAKEPEAMAEAPSETPAALPMRKVVSSTEPQRQETMRQEFESLPPPPAQPKRLEARRAALEAKESAGELPGAAPVAPVQIVVNPAPPAAPAPVPVPAPAPATAAAQTPTAPAVQAMPGMQLEPVSFGGPLGFRPAQPIVPPLDLEPSQGLQMGEQFAAPAAVGSALADMTPLAAAAARAAAPAAPTASAPVAPAVAPTAVAPIVSASAFQPVEPPAMPTADAVRAAVAAAPPGTPVSTVVQGLMPGIAIPPLEVARIDALPPPTQNIKLFDRGVERAIQGAVEQAQVDYQAAADEIRIAEESVKRKAEIEEQARQDLASLQSSAAEMRRAAEAGENLQSFGASVGWGNAIGSLFALMAGGFASGYAGIPNYAMAAFDKAMDRDLAEQRRRRDSLWSRYKDALGDTEDAKKLWQASMADLAAGRMKLMAAQTNLGRVSPAMQKAIADIEMRSAQLRDDVVRGDAAARFAAEEAESDVELKQARAKAALRPRAGGGAALARERYETGRTVGVGGVPVQTSTITGAAQTNRNLANRNFSVLSLTKAVDLLEKTTPAQFADFTGDKRAEAIATLAYAVENFPQAFGYERAVSQSAARQLKIGLQNPTESRGVFTNLISRTGEGGRKPSTGLKILRDEAAESRRQFVKQLAMAGSARDQEAAEYGLWKLESEDARAIGKPPPKMPKLTFSIRELEQTPFQRSTGASAPSAAAPVVAPAGAPSAPGRVDRSKLRKIGQ